MIEVIEESFESSLMNRVLPFRVVLPENYRISGTEYPVLYLLHGLFGNCRNWLELTGLRDYLAAEKYVVVLPDASDSWYTDSATAEGNKFESSFINEFMPAIEEKYKIARSRRKRAIAGLSMGGYGALKFALKRPEAFIFAGSMSGAFNAPFLTENSPDADWGDLKLSISEAFGQENTSSRLENDLFGIVRAIPEHRRAALPRIYFDCGTEDRFLQVNRQLSELLKEKKIAFDYLEISGGHDWVYWDRRIKVILKIIGRVFNQSGT